MLRNHLNLQRNFIAKRIRETFRFTKLKIEAANQKPHVLQIAKALNTEKHVRNELFSRIDIRKHDDY